MVAAVGEPAFCRSGLSGGPLFLLELHFGWPRHTAHRRGSQRRPRGDSWSVRGRTRRVWPAPVGAGLQLGDVPRRRNLLRAPGRSAGRAPLPTHLTPAATRNPIRTYQHCVNAKLTQERDMSSVLSSTRNAGPAAAQGAPVERCPLPIPLGWFFVGYGAELPAGELRSIEYFGQEWILFRNQAGE